MVPRLPDLAALCRDVMLAIALKQEPAERNAMLAIMVKDGHLPPRPERQGMLP